MRVHRWHVPGARIAKAALVIGLFSIVLAFDLVLPRGYNVTFVYAAVVIAAWRLRIPGLVTLSTVGAVVATWVVLPFKKQSDGSLADHVLFDRSVSTLAVMAATAMIAVLILREREAARLGDELDASHRLRAQDKRMLAAASEVTPIGVWSISSAGDLFEWSDAACEMHGYAPGQHPSVEFVADLVHPADRARFLGAIADAWRTGQPWREEFRITRPDGAERWILKMGTSREVVGGAAISLHGTVQDITQWKAAEERASDAHHRLTQFASILPLVVWTADPLGRVDYINSTLETYLGRPVEYSLGHGWLDHVDVRDVERATDAWWHSLDAGDTFSTDVRMVADDGNAEWFHIHAEPERAEDGRISRWWGTAVNINAHRLLQEETLAMAAQHEAVLESLPSGVLVIDKELCVTYANASAEAISGSTRDELLGLPVWRALPVAESHPIRAAIAAAMDHRQSGVLTCQCEEWGAWLSVVAAPSPAGVNVFFDDVTEPRMLAERLAQAERLESIGLLTGGIAHDFNNLLTVVLGGADALASDPTLSGESRESVGLIEAAAMRGAGLTHRLLSFARRQPLAPQSVDLGDRIRRLEPLLRRSVGESVDLVLATSATHSPAETDPGQFDNALLNLAINAKDAMPRGGTLTIEVFDTTVDEAHAASHSELTPGTYAMVVVTDSGVGIPAEILQRIFDPFFTTKGGAQGYGMGLAMVWGFAKQSGGHVAVYSELAHGTSVRLYLPVATDPASTASAPSQPPAGHHGGTILVAEDDPLVRALAVQQLRAAGYRVHDAADGPAALEALENIPHLDLLFTDVVMPRAMTGRQLADAVEAARPGTPVIYASGYTENVVVHQGRLDLGVNLLAKPYTGRELLARVAAALAERSHPSHGGVS